MAEFEAAAVAAFKADAATDCDAPEEGSEAAGSRSGFIGAEAAAPISRVVGLARGAGAGALADEEDEDDEEDEEC